jgi:repressor LexA
LSKEKLTSKQKRLVEAIEASLLQHGTAPTYRELMKQLGYRSTGSIYRFMKSLKMKGVIKDSPRSWRNAELVTRSQEETGSVISVDVIGQVSRKSSPELLQKTHQISIPCSLVGKDVSVYGLIVQDASFVDEHLLPGDLILVEPTETISPGELVLASTNKSIIGHFFEEGETIRFRSSPYSSGGVPPSIVVKAAETQVWGIIVGIIRATGQFPLHSHPELLFSSLGPNE